jgi:hypothetical protein
MMPLPANEKGISSGGICNRITTAPQTADVFIGNFGVFYGKVDRKMGGNHT